MFAKRQTNGQPPHSEKDEGVFFYKMFHIKQMFAASGKHFCKTPRKTKWGIF